MPSMSNAFLQNAKQLTTPRKKDVVKTEKDELTPSPPAQSKKLCSTFEKWVKKQDGDTSVLRDAKLIYIYI